MRNRFGTFGGVFTPAILTILGVIMFMRANFVVGQAGVLGAVVILLIAKSITTATSFSIAAISTNMRVRGGGSYFMISRVLGPEFGGAIGIALFFALVLSVPFYILGFSEALVRSYPALAPRFQQITLLTAAVLFAVAYFGAGWAIRTQYLIMACLFVAIFTFLAGAAQHFSMDTLRQNMAPGYTPLPAGDAGLYSFWMVFAIYFPAVTGIDAGVNMSGDLKDPGRSIPRGTFAAVGVGFLVYLLQIILAGGAFPRAGMIEAPFEMLRDNAFWRLAFLVTMGVVAATLSSALSSYLGAPRVLQAVSRDRLLSFLHFFARGSAQGDEPRRALVLCFCITLLVLLWAGDSSGGGALNAVAAIITMFFLYSYGMMNLAAFIEDFGNNPSFRPRFRLFHWSIALAGSIGCFVVAFLINWFAALLAVLLILLLLWYLKTRHMQARFGDARRGFFYSSVRKNLVRLSRMKDDPKNWRPTVLVFSGSPTHREDLISYALWFEARRGLVYLANVLVGDFAELVSRRAAAINQLVQFCMEKDFEAFPLVVIAPSVEQGSTMIMQTSVTGPMHPNLVILGWSKKQERLAAYLAQIRTAEALGMSTVLLAAHELPEVPDFRRIDVWWRGQKNGGLMLLLAYLMQQNWEWEHAQIRVLRVIEQEAGRVPAQEALAGLVQAARVEAIAEIIISDCSFEEVLAQYSHDADMTMLGFEVPADGLERAWQQMYSSYAEKVPALMLVNSRGGEGLLT